MKYAVLEMRLPKDTFKSPLAMEVFLQSIHNASDGTKFNQYWSGDIRPYYSLEIISIEGEVKFMAWMEDRRKAGFITALYSQFPEIEVHERADYAQSVHFDPAKLRIWCGEFKLIKDDAYPIKTYVDYGLDRDPKEEFKVDPLVPIIEFLGSVRPNQQVWIQIMVQAHKKTSRPGFWFKTIDKWEDGAKKLVNELMARDPNNKTSIAKDDDGRIMLTMLSKGEQETIAAIERSQTKLPFDVGIRALYIAPKDAFDTPFGIGGIVGGFNHFKSGNLNGFKPNGDKWHVSLDAPWKDFQNRRRNKLANLALMAYRRRSYFYPPFDGASMVLNTEELATIYHFPGSVAATPSLSRIPSKKGEAPQNLPI
jgi:hypothetical protein